MSSVEEESASIQLIRLERVVRRFGSKVVLRGVTADLHAGCVHVIGGANGVGKSTLLKVIGAELRPTSGQVTLVPTVARSWARQHMGLITQGSRMYPDLTAWENVLLSARLHGVLDPQGWARAAVSRLGGGGFWGQQVRTLSTGQLQRAALARVLVWKPSVLLLDEPLAGLDRTGAEVVIDMVKMVAGAGGLVVVVTHQAFEIPGAPVQRWVLRRGLLAGVEHVTYRSSA